MHILTGATDVSVEVSRGSGGNSGGNSFVKKGGGTFLGHPEIRAENFEDVGLVKIVDATLVRLLLFLVDEMGVLPTASTSLISKPFHTGIIACL